MGVTWEVRELHNKQEEIPTKKDLEALKMSLSTDLTHAASERVKFYMEHAKLECDPAARGHKQNCRLVWPVPED
jgi:fructose/tagatose bisphosphate aldolase